MNLDAPELVEGVTGRWLGQRGIFRHFQPTTIEAIQESVRSGQAVSHVMSTAASGAIVGQLIRWVDAQADEVTVEARIDGTEDSAGICDIVAYSYDDLRSISKVTSDLRYEWAELIDDRWEVHKCKTCRDTGQATVQRFGTPSIEPCPMCQLDDVVRTRQR